MRLYELAGALEAIISGGLAYDEETGEVLFDSENLDELEAAIDDKLEGCGIVIKGLEAEAEAIKAEEQRLSDRRRRKEREAEQLREYVLSCMERTGEKVVETPRIRLSTRRSQYVDVIDEEAVPQEFFTVKQTTSVNKSKLLKAMKGGEEVTGCQLGERFSLQVK